MELLQALQVFSGRNRQFFAGTVVHCLSIGSGLDVYRVFHDSVCRCEASDFGDPVAGWASTVCIILFIGGVQLLCMGIMGQYLAKAYLEVKHRPHYIISETNDEAANRVG